MRFVRCEQTPALQVPHCREALYRITPATNEISFAPRGMSCNTAERENRALFRERFTTALLRNFNGGAEDPVKIMPEFRLVPILAPLPTRNVDQMPSLVLGISPALRRSPHSNRCPMRPKLRLAVAVLVALATRSAAAQSYGVDLRETLMPAAGAMGGTSVARPQDFLSGINGNAATLTQYRGTNFTVGSAWAEATFNIDQTGNVPLPGITPFSAKSQTPGSAFRTSASRRRCQPMACP